MLNESLIELGALLLQNPYITHEKQCLPSFDV